MFSESLLGTRSRNPLWERVLEDAVDNGNCFLLVSTSNNNVSHRFVVITRHTRSNSLHNSIPATMPKPTKGEKTASKAKNFISPLPSSSRYGSTPNSRSAKRIAKRKLAFESSSPTGESSNKRTKPATTKNAATTTVPVDSDSSSTTTPKAKDDNDKLFFAGLTKDKTAIKEALEKSNFKTNNAFVQALFVTFQSTVHVLTRVAYIVDTLIEQTLIDDKNNVINAPLEDQTRYNEVPADFVYYIRMFLDKTTDGAFTLITPGGNKSSLTRRLSDYQLGRKWQTLTLDVLSLGLKSRRYDTIRKYLHAYLSLVRWFATHVKTPPAPARHKHDGVSFHYDSADLAVTKTETTNYMNEFVGFFQSLIASTPIRNLTAIGSDQQGLCDLLHEARAKVVKDLPQEKVILDPSIAKELVLSPEVPRQIENTCDVQGFYDASIRSLWNVMQHPELRAFRTISLSHFSDQALFQPNFVESFLPSLARCSFLVIEGTVTIPYRPEVLYNLIMNKSELLLFYDVTVDLSNAGSEICLTRHEPVLVGRRRTKNRTFSRQDAVFRLTTQKVATDHCTSYFTTLLMASIEVNLRDYREYETVQPIFARILVCSGK